jgi:hypothetical protein
LGEIWIAFIDIPGFLAQIRERKQTLASKVKPPMPSWQSAFGRCEHDEHEPVRENVK